SLASLVAGCHAYCASRSLRKRRSRAASLRSSRGATRAVLPVRAASVAHVTIVPDRARELSALRHVPACPTADNSSASPVVVRPSARPGVSYGGQVAGFSAQATLAA